MTADVLEAIDPPFRLTAPIDRIEQLEDGTLLVHTIVTSETPDNQPGVMPGGIPYAGEIVDYDAFKEAAPELMKWASLQEMHDPHTASGTILRLYFDDQARRVEADIHVVDPTAVKKVLTKVYKAVSIHGAKLASRIERLRGRNYRRITKLISDELSLVNRPANADAVLSKAYVLAKRGDLPMDIVPGIIATPEAALTKIARTPQQQSIDVVREALAKAAEAAADAEVDPAAPADSDFPAKGEEELTKMADTGEGEGELAMAAAPADAAAAADAAAEVADEAVEAAVEAVAEATVEAEAAERVEDAAAATDDAGEELAEAAPPPAAAAEPDAEMAKAAAPAEDLMKAGLEELLREYLEDRRASRVGVTAAPAAPTITALEPLAKAGARNAGVDQARIDAIHDLAVALGASTHAGAEAAPEPPAEPLAKAAPAPDPLQLMRDALAPLIPADKLSAIEERLVAIGEKQAAQDEVLSKIAKSPTTGGPANPFAFLAPRGAGSGVTDKASALEAAAQVIDDPRLRGEVGQAAALELIRASRGSTG